MCDTGVLIMAVEKQPCLWDGNHKDYHNREIKELAWEVVCNEVYEDWDSMDERDKARKCK